MGTNNPFSAEMVKMHIPEGMGSSVVIAGFTLEADEDECVTVPKNLAKGLEAHGLTPYVAPAKAPLGLPKK